MRILSVTETYVPFFQFGGPPVKVKALAQGLAGQGHQVTVLTADWGLKSLRTTGSQKFAAKQGPHGWQHEENGVQTIYLPTWLRYRTLTWNPGVKHFCRSLLCNFDVVHIFGLYDLLGPAVAAACHQKKLPFVLEPMGMFVPIVRNLWMKRIYHALFGKHLFEGACTVIATSDQESQELAAGGIPQQKIVLRRNGVEAPTSWPTRGSFRAAYGIPSDAKLVLFLGRLSEKKSPNLLLQAFAALGDFPERKTARLVFVGPDEDGLKTRLEREAARLGLSSRVQFVGPLFEEAKWSAYRDADVFVLPSQNENFGNSAAEAAAAGTPVIVTQQCGIAPLIADVAGLVVRHEVGSLACALRKLLGEPGLRAQFAAGCAAVTSRLDWKEPVRELEALYSKVAGNRALVAQSGTMG